MKIVFRITIIINSIQVGKIILLKFYSRYDLDLVLILYKTELYS